MKEHTEIFPNSIKTSPIVLWTIPEEFGPSMFSTGWFNGTSLAKFREQHRHVLSRLYVSERAVNIFFFEITWKFRLTKARLPQFSCFGNSLFTPPFGWEFLLFGFGSIETEILVWHTICFLAVIGKLFLVTTAPNIWIQIFTSKLEV